MTQDEKMEKGFHATCVADYIIVKCPYYKQCKKSMDESKATHTVKRGRPKKVVKRGRGRPRKTK